MYNSCEDTCSYSQNKKHEGVVSAARLRCDPRRAWVSILVAWMTSVGR